MDVWECDLIDGTITAQSRSKISVNGNRHLFKILTHGSPKIQNG